VSPAVEQIRKTVEDRLRELEPVIGEIEQLRAILGLLDSRGEESNGELTAMMARAGLGGGMPLPLVRRGRRGTKPGRDGRAPQGANKRAILEAVLAEPGIAAPEIAAQTGLKRTVVSATINRLKRRRELEPYRDGVRVPLV
jgi:hypothetical protein